MNKNELIGIFRDWNFWDKDLETGVQRNLYLDELEKMIAGEQVKAITGARRSGKSYIMRQLAARLMKKKGVDKNNILIINFEDPRFINLSTGLIQQAFEVYLEFCRPKGGIYVFLDEVQEVPGWEKWVRTAHELGKANLMVTGSNSKLLGGELATSLTGRHLDMTVMPLSFSEFLRFKESEEKETCTIMDGGKRMLLKEFVKFGSFPLVVKSAREWDKENILLAYYDDVVNKDLIKRYKIRKTEEIKSLAKFYLSNISRPITFSASGKFLEMSTLSAKRFSAYLENSYLVFFLKRFSFKAKEQEKSPRKVYAIDTGLAGMIGFQFSPNSGRLAENTVFLELKRRSYFNPRQELYYWKNLAQEEVDFAVKENDKVKELIQVCWDLRDINTRKRETRALLKAMDAFGLKSGLIITEDYNDHEQFGGKKIRYMALEEWLMPENQK